MPTGYTAEVVDGKITDFPAFVMICARAFGALISMRDEPMDAPIPDEIKPSNYYVRKVEDRSRELGAVQKMTDAEARTAAEADHAKALKSRSDYLARQDAEAARINAMLAQVRAWTPPTPDHTEMKKFMIEQLTISLPGSYVPAMPELLDGPTWRQRKIDELAVEIARSKDERDKENERAAKRTKWVKDLRASLAA